MVPIRFVHKTAANWALDGDDMPPLPEDWSHPVQNGTQAWIVQTWTHLKRAGYPVSLSDRYAQGHINVVHYDHLKAKDFPTRYFVVAVQADRGRPEMCNMRIVQNRKGVRMPECDVFMDHWPQPGLIPRSTNRPDRIKSIGYFGLPNYLPEFAKQASFRDKLALRDVSFHIRSEPDQWRDYSDIDAVFAMREATDYYIGTKPATKLFNAWLAGSVPFMGREPAYRDAGTPGVDYLEIGTEDQFFESLDRLLADPAQTDAIRAAGNIRAEKLTVKVVTAEWVGFLFGAAQEEYASSRKSFYRRTRSAMTLPAKRRSHRREENEFKQNQ